MAVRSDIMLFRRQVVHDLQIVTDCHGAALWMLRQIPVIISSAVSDPVVTLEKTAPGITTSVASPGTKTWPASGS